MKKNNLVIVIVVVLILAVAGWWYFGKNNGALNQGGMMSNGIADLFGQNVSMTCTYTDEEGRQATTHIKNGAIRSDYTGATAEETGSMILRDKVVYTWQGKEGIKMTIPDVTIT
ncbi:MAG TPA: hypothetical protein VLF20_04175, partial [Patescibacteria group bacterium]|nr:hypothetical protein [Patescibacteria group bacterium]